MAGLILDGAKIVFASAPVEPIDWSMVKIVPCVGESLSVRAIKLPREGGESGGDMNDRRRQLEADLAAIKGRRNICGEGANIDPRPGHRDDRLPEPRSRWFEALRPSRLRAPPKWPAAVFACGLGVVLAFLALRSVARSSVPPVPCGRDRMADGGAASSGSAGGAIP